LKKQPSLSSFNGKSVKGVWQLVVRGSRSERWGMLHSWELIVTPVDDMMDPENESAEASAVKSPDTATTSAVSQSAPQSQARAAEGAADARMSGGGADPGKSEARRVAIERYQQILKSREGMTGTEAKQIYMQKYGSGDKSGKSGYGKEKREDKGKKYDKVQKDKSDYKRAG
jgi:hypothetical protein